MSFFKGVDKALDVLRTLPRLSVNNIRPTPGTKSKKKRGRGRYGGNKHGCGNKGSGQRQNFMRIGYETGNNPFYLRVPKEPYYRGHHIRRQYPPLPLSKLQLMIDTGRIDATQPIDLSTICNTFLYQFSVVEKHHGVHLTHEGADLFQAKVNIEVQWASEPVIAAVERNGGVITTAFYDVQSLLAAGDPVAFFRKGVPIPPRILPPPDLIEFYSSAVNRGYLADPDKVAEERFALAQKYGYELPDLSEDSDYEMLMKRKDPRQVFFGLQPGWVVNLRDRCILKPKDQNVQEYYNYG